MQFGHALPQILQHIVYVNLKFGPVQLIKIDLANGYYHIPVSSTGAQQLGMIMPTEPGQEPLIAFPLTLPMGQNKSPPYFCAFTETAADVCNQQLQAVTPDPQFLKQHHLEQLIQQYTPSPHLSNLQTTTIKSIPTDLLLAMALAYIEIYIDDFIGVT